MINWSSLVHKLCIIETDIRQKIILTINIQLMDHLKINGW
jgi:hypothetical protein